MTSYYTSLNSYWIPLHKTIARNDRPGEAIRPGRAGHGRPEQERGRAARSGQRKTNDGG